MSRGAHIKRIQQNVIFAVLVSGWTICTISHFDCRSWTFVSTELLDPILLTVDIHPPSFIRLQWERIACRPGIRSPLLVIITQDSRGEQPL